MDGASLRLVEHLKRFVDGVDESTEWARQAEALLDGLHRRDELIDELEEFLALYRPEGGPHLYGRKEMDQFLRRIIPKLEKRSSG